MWKNTIHKGLETYEGKYVYAQRRDGKISMVRFNLRKKRLGAFIGRLNYGATFGSGLELFSNRFAIGFIKNKSPLISPKFYKKSYSGSLSEPYHTTVKRFGRVYIVYRTSESAIKKLNEKLMREWEEYYDNHPEV